MSLDAFFCGIVCQLSRLDELNPNFGQNGNIFVTEAYSAGKCSVETVR